MLRKLIYGAIALTILFTTGCRNSSTAVVQSGESSLGQRLFFPEGYRLVSFAIHNTDATTTVTYVCQSKTDEDEYRVCIPKTTD